MSRTRQFKKDLDAGLFDNRNDVNGEKWSDKKISFPFCLRTENETSYWRYAEDGRFEYLCMKQKECCLSFGTYEDKISGIIQDKEFYFKVLSNRFIVISNEEFGIALKRLIEFHGLFMEAKAFLSKEVEEEIKLIKADNNEIEIKQQNNSIITSNNEEDPF